MLNSVILYVSCVWIHIDIINKILQALSRYVNYLPNDITEITDDLV